MKARHALSLCALGTLIAASSAEGAALPSDGLALAAPLVASTPKTAILMAAGILGMGIAGRREERERNGKPQ